VPDRGPFEDALEKLEFPTIRSHIAAFCASLYGKARVEQLTPSSIPAEVIDELARVDEMLRLLRADDAPPLEMIEDVRAALHRAAKEGSVVAAEDFLHIGRVLSVLRVLKSFFTKRADRFPMLAGLAADLPEDKMLEYHIERVIDDEGAVKDGASKELRSIRRDIIEKSGQLRRRMENILRRFSEEDIVMEDLVTMRDGRMVLPIKAEYKRKIQGFIHSTSATGQTVYIEPTETLDLNNDIRDLQFSELREVHAILSDLTGRLRQAVSSILRGLEIYAEIDSFYARARYAWNVGAVCPAVRRDGPLTLQCARHPLLLLHKNMQDVVPLDITVGDSVSTILITGPNAGGKSVSMKTVGLAALMLQSGMPVPCDSESSFPIYDNVFVDIGDEQSLENDLSTFSSHISRLASIVLNAGPRSLVLIDEIGTGTDPSEGSALGAAILEHLTVSKAHVIATTHHGMLKAFAHEHPGMLNSAMEFDVRTLQPTYKFRAGLPGSSYAFEITRRHGMDLRIIDRAKEILGTRSDALEQLLAEVERQAQDLAAHVRNAEQLEVKSLTMSREYEAKLKTVKKEAHAIRKQALEQAERVLAQANAAVEESVREIREQQASREVIRQAHERISKQRERIAKDMSLNIEEQLETETQAPKDIRPGDEVFMIDNPATRGVVLEVPSGGRVAVAFGSMRMNVAVEGLRKHSRPDQVTTQGLRLPEPLESNEIDVRGMFGDDAVREVDGFVHQAWMNGIPHVHIIHGKGTGALRSRVHAFLKELSFVESFQLGEWNEGGSGMTKVVFKSE